MDGDVTSLGNVNAEKHGGDDLRQRTKRTRMHRDFGDPSSEEAGASLINLHPRNSCRVIGTETNGRILIDGHRLVRIISSRTPSDLALAEKSPRYASDTLRAERKKPLSSVLEKIYYCAERERRK